MKNRELKKAVESMDQISRTLKKMPTPPIIPVGIMGTIDGELVVWTGKNWETVSDATFQETREPKDSPEDAYDRAMRGVR
jgi:alpha-acetolactate decarboxylase